MARRVLVTGGAGFIGSHIVDALLAQGDDVRILDNLTPQVHGEGEGWPAYLNREAECVHGDIRDRETLRRALQGVTAISHQASAVGVGQSMYEIARYTDVNVGGTALLLDLLANERHSVERLVVASSMSIYGEGAYRCPEHGVQDVALRPAAQLAARDWELHCSTCSAVLQAVPTREDKPLRPTSVYAVNKRDQEEMCLCVGRAYNIATVALRYFNTYGPRQALSNPYTGAVAIFSSRLLNKRGPIVYEDGRQSRDFTHVRDIVQANVKALRPDGPRDVALNIGTGRPTDLLQLVAALNGALGTDMQARIEAKFRHGDIRHCYADIAAAREALGYEPSVALQDGLVELVGWLRQETPRDMVEAAQQELAARGLAT
ncbi:MAG: SDR family NAD(P)-dependent oxidoreductase [Chloroflexota bacterium]